jgi:hypothetical protein
MIKRYYDYVSESSFDPISYDLRRFRLEGLEIRHKVIFDNVGSSYSVWYYIGDEYPLQLIRRTGKHAISVGGFSPSISDLFMMSPGKFIAVIKTNRDDIVPDEVISQVASYLQQRSKSNDDVLFGKKNFVTLDSGKPSIEPYHMGIFSNGSIKK